MIIIHKRQKITTNSSNVFRLCITPGIIIWYNIRISFFVDRPGNHEANHQQ